MSRARSAHTLATVLHRLRRRAYLVNASLALLLLVLSAPQAGPSNSADAAELLAVYWAFAALSAVGLLIQHRWPLYALGLTVAGAAGHALSATGTRRRSGFPR